MAIEEKERIIIPDENGQEHMFEVVFTFDVHDTGNSYVVVKPLGEEYDDSDDDSDDVEVFAFRYEEKGDGTEEDDLALFQIESDEEWEIVEEMIHTFSDDQEGH